MEKTSRRATEEESPSQQHPSLKIALAEYLITFVLIYVKCIDSGGD